MYIHSIHYNIKFYQMIVRQIIFSIVVVACSGCEESRQIVNTKITDDYPKLSSVPCRPNLPEIAELKQEKQAMEKEYNRNK